jgi:hypothetical protein
MEPIDVAVAWLEAVDSLASDLEPAFAEHYPNDVAMLDAYALTCLARGTSTAKAATLLFRNGHTEEALALVRGLIELLIHCAWVFHDVEKCEVRLYQLLLDEQRSKRKVFDALARDSGLSREERKANRDRVIGHQQNEQAIIDRLQLDLGVKEIPGKETSVKDKAKDLGLLGLYQVQYAHLSHAVHSNLPSLQQFIRQGEKGLHISPAGSVDKREAVRMTLFDSLLDLTMVVSQSCPIFRLPDSEGIISRHRQTQRHLREIALAADDRAEN